MAESWISAYDKDWKLSGHSFSFVNSVNFPLIMYGKFVWPNLIWPDKWLIWPENVLWLALIVSPENATPLLFQTINQFNIRYIVSGFGVFLHHWTVKYRTATQFYRAQCRRRYDQGRGIEHCEDSNHHRYLYISASQLTIIARYLWG